MSMTWLANCEGTTAWANHTWEEFASLKDKHLHLVVLPLHGIADHGMGLPLDVEELIGGELLRRAVTLSISALRVRVLPPLRFVLAPIRASFFGVDPETAHDLILEIASGVHAAGFRKLVFWNTSPWNAEFMDVVARDVRVAFGLNTYYVNLSGLGLDFHPAASGRTALQAMGALLSGAPPSDDMRAGDVRDRLFRPGSWRQPEPVKPDSSIDPLTLLEKSSSHLSRLLSDIDADGQPEAAGQSDSKHLETLRPKASNHALPPGTPWPAYRTRYLPALTRGELDAWANKDRTLVILPTAAIEQHGYHLPVGVDSILGQAFLEATLRKLDPGLRVLVAPPITFGKSNEHEGFPGTISISAKSLRRLLLALVRQLHDLGFRFFAVLNTHGGNSATVVYTLREIQSTFGVRAGMLSSGFTPPLSDIERDFGFHAGEWESSLMMAAAPALVRFERAVCEYPARPDDPGELRPENAPAIASWISSDISRSGTMGDATAATVEKGRLWMEEWSAGLARQISELARSAET